MDEGTVSVIGDGHAPGLVDGPEWSLPGLDVAAGRYPLSVERHVMAMADHLVPGVTTVTPHGRYYALHGLIAAQADAEDLTVPEAQSLLRRAEVALAAVSFAHHPQTLEWLPRAHGTDALARRLHAGTLTMSEAEAPGKDGYVGSRWGFWGPYNGSEIALGILAPGPMPAPGPRLETAAVRTGLDGLLELARADTLPVDSLTSFGDRLCVCAGGERADGEWLAKVMCEPAEPAETGSRSTTRRQTIQLLARVVTEHPERIRRFTRDIGPVLAFGDFLTSDSVTSGIDTAAAWRGVVLRNYSVGAWRRLWSWLVAQVDGLLPIEEVADRFAAELPDTTVDAFLSALPATQSMTGAPLPAEDELRKTKDSPLPLTELRVLAVGARRVDELSGRVRDAFLGRRGVELGPEWTQRRLDEARPMKLHDFARRITHDLVARSQRIARAKARRRPDGTLWLPTRLHERGGLLYRTSQEGRGDVGLRLDQLGTVLATCGVLRYDGGSWSVTDRGRALLG
ncbi:hypothetical protein [Actinacidiphila epipremni]|uniref:Uncharacterized protein n=1 Tax=Actinacidiphila epipremni TaxID=2053013 RepID=A0ABX0ZSC3_9ACTN|nr:hypothetical protein [Actinacidiphila epipremni]NJP44491.1 hypothetical protein [Actinacidiphila epipremni]